MNQLDLENFECDIGLMDRAKDNHNNHILFRFGDLKKMIEYYNSFKKELFNQKIKSSSNKKIDWQEKRLRMNERVY